jgi:phage shock protein A
MFITKEAKVIKMFLTLFRGQTARVEEEFADRHALLLLEQQIRDSAAGLDRARRALAVAMAQDATETNRLTHIKTKIADLEQRATAALNGGREDLAAEAAEAIANLEADRDSAEAAHVSFRRESGKLRNLVANGERRLAELQRGRRSAQAADAVRRLHTSGAVHIGGEAGPLKDAEATLNRLRQKQAEAEAADDALGALDGASAPDLIAEKLEAAGFGEKTRSTAASVLERLKQRRAAQPAPV